MSYTPKPGSQAETLVKAILKAGTIRTPALAEVTAAPAGNHNSQLLAAVSAGLITHCMVTADNGKEMREYRAGPGLPNGFKPLDLNKTRIAGSPQLARSGGTAQAPVIDKPLPAANTTNKPNASKPKASPQPQVGNSGSASSGITSTLLAEGRAVADKSPEPSVPAAKAPASDVSAIAKQDPLSVSINNDGRLHIEKCTIIEQFGVFLTAEQTKQLGDFMFATRLAWHR